MIWQTCLVNEFYDVSDLGDVRRINTGRILKQTPGHNGYLLVSLSGNGVVRSYRVNRLVLLTFTGIDPDPTKVEAAHENGIRSDNRLDNLVWKDTYGNYLDRLKHGTQIIVSPLTEDDVFLMRNEYANGLTQSAIAKKRNVSASCVSRIVTGARWNRG